jgi:hypothetical protein
MDGFNSKKLTHGYFVPKVIDGVKRNTLLEPGAILGGAKDINAYAA